MRRIAYTLLATFVVCSLACQEPQPRLNAPPHGNPNSTSDLQGMYTYMIDNALLSDMSISDMHFMPHRPILNTLGKQRLNRLVSLVEAYGGTIRLSSNVEDEDLLQARLDMIHAYLADAGTDLDQIQVKLDLPGGHGLQSDEILLIRENIGVYKPGDAADADSELGGDSE